MSTVALNHVFKLPESLEKFIVHSHSDGGNERKRIDSSIPADILETPKEYIFYFDVPGLSKSDIQITVEGGNTLVIKSGGKRKREDSEEEGCKYIMLERRKSQKMMRKFSLPDNANSSAITAKCDNGVLTVIVEKHPPPPNPKTVEIVVS